MADPFEGIADFAERTPQAPVTINDPFSDIADFADPSESQRNLGILPFANRAIAATLGAPVDIIAGGLSLIPGVDILDPVGGSKSIERLFSFIGAPSPPPGREPETLPEFAGRGLGEVAGLAFPAGRIIKGLSKGVNLTGRVADMLLKSMVKHPALTIAGEVGGGLGAGIARGVGEQEFPESPGLKGTIELGGGIIGGLVPTLLINTPTAIAVRTGKNIFRKFTLPFTKGGAEFRAGEFIKGEVPDPGAVITRITEETIADLPPAVASGEQRLSVLLKSLMAKDPLTEVETIETLSKAVVKLEGEMRKFGFGSPELLADITRNRVAAIELGIDRRIAIAIGEAEKKLNTLPIARRATEESRIVRSEIEAVMRQELDKTKQLWAKVSKNTPVGFEKTRETLRILEDDLAFSQRNDAPFFLRKDPVIIDKELTSTSIREMQGLRSKLLETARIARSKGQWNKARIAGDVADAILEDIGIVARQATTPESATLQAALASTRRNKERFEQGIVGKILGLTRTGAPAIDPSLTLDISVGRLGARGAVDISKVAITPEAKAATERFITRSYTDFALNKQTGILDPVKANTWVKNNEAILDQFPDLRTQLTDASQAQELATRTQGVLIARKRALQDPKISQAARFLRSSDLNLEVESIFKSNNPARTANQLARQARKDPTGDALEGMKSGIVDFVLEKASIGAFNEAGEQTLSGKTLLNFINRNSGALKQFFTPEEISRMNRIGKELAKIETFEATKAGQKEIELKDIASSMLRLVSRVSGAQAGRWVAGVTGGGTVQTPGIFSERFRDFTTRLTKNRAQQLIHDAITSKDPALLRSLLLPIDKPGSRTTQRNLLLLNESMNLWLTGTGRRVMSDIEDEIRGETP